MLETLTATPIENAPFSDEVLNQVHEVAERITARVRHLLPDELHLDESPRAAAFGRPFDSTGTT